MWDGVSSKNLPITELKKSTTNKLFDYDFDLGENPDRGSFNGVLLLRDATVKLMRDQLRWLRNAVFQ